MPYDPERTKAAVFAAAVDEFAAHGLAGARVARIAEAACVDKKAIYLYFGDKRALFDAVLAHELGHLATAVPLEGPQGADDLADYATRLFDYHREHPHHLRLLLWEALEVGDEEVPERSARAAHYRRRSDSVVAGQEAGLLAPVPARQLWLAVAAMVSWNFAAPQVVRMTLGENEAVLDEFRSVLADCVRRLARPDVPAGAVT